MAWIEPFEPHAGLVGGELPMDGHPRRVALIFQGSRLVNEPGSVANAPAPTLALKDADLDFGDIQPTAMFGRVRRETSKRLRIRRASAGGKTSYRFGERLLVHVRIRQTSRD